MAKKVVNGEEKYFLYYANGGGSSNVITGESPLGPWTSERTSTLINGSTPGAEGVAWLFDPAPFVDDDGEEYLYLRRWARVDEHAARRSASTTRRTSA